MPLNKDRDAYVMVDKSTRERARIIAREHGITIREVFLHAINALEVRGERRGQTKRKPKVR